MASNRTSTTPHHHLQDPVTGLYYAEGPDGLTLTPKTHRATAFLTAGLAIEYATHHLAGQAAEVVRVTP